MTLAAVIQASDELKTLPIVFRLSAMFKEDGRYPWQHFISNDCTKKLNTQSKTFD